MRQPEPDQRRISADRAEARPSKTRLGRILAERPEARPRLARAVGGLLAVALATIAVIGALLIWHFRRRAGFLRERLAAGAGCRLSHAELELPESESEDDPKSSPLDSRRSGEELEP